MTARFQHFDPTPGGSYRLILTYADPTGSGGKSAVDSDVVDARYVDIVRNDRVVQAVDFVSDDPAFAGTMTMTWAVHAEDGGTRVEITADNVPGGISADDHATGMASSLDNLASYLEPWISTRETVSEPSAVQRADEVDVLWLVGEQLRVHGIG